MASHYAALVLSDMEAVSEIFTHGFDDDSDRMCQVESAAAEIRAALNLTRRAADNELLMALDLVEKHPKVHEALSTGRIDQRRVRVIMNGIFHLDDATAALVVDHIIDDAPNLTTGQLSAKIRRCRRLNARPSNPHDRRRENRLVAPRRTLVCRGCGELLVEFPRAALAPIVG
jgi:hypothetical protein